MKHLFTLIILSLFLMGFAKAQNGLTYQAVVRDDTQHLVSETPIGVQISIIKGGEHGIVVLQERHFPTTDINGLISIVIGDGTLVYGDFNAIVWEETDLWVKTEIDLNGGSNYSMETITPLFPVPYSFYAVNSTRAKVAERLEGETFDGWDKDKSDDFSGSYLDLFDVPNLIEQADVQALIDQNRFSKDYRELINTPYNVSFWYNDAGYITRDTIDMEVMPDVDFLIRQLIDEAAESYLTEELDGDPTNEIQDLQLIGNALFLTKSTTPVDLSPLDESDQIQILSGIIDRLENKLETLDIRCNRRINDLEDSLRIKTRRLEIRIEELEEE